MEKGLEKA